MRSVCVCGVYFILIWVAIDMGSVFIYIYIYIYKSGVSDVRVKGLVAS